MKKLLLMLLLSGISIQDLKASDREDHDGSSSESADDKINRPARRRRGADGAPVPYHRTAGAAGAAGAAPVPDQRAAGAAEGAAEGFDWKSLSTAARNRREAAAPVDETKVSRGIKRKAKAGDSAGAATEATSAKEVLCDRCENKFTSEQEVQRHQEGYGNFSCPEAPCSVCLEPLGDLDQVTFKGCGHVFHTRCKEQLQQTNFGCISCGGSKLPLQQLFSAASRGDVAAVTTLLGTIPQNEHADFVRMPNESSRTALHVAAEYGRHNVVAALLAYVPENEQADYVRMAGQDGYTALHVAVAYRNHAAISRLLNAVPPDEQAQLVGSVAGTHRNNALHYAVLRGSTAAAVNTLLIAIPAAERAAFIQRPNGDGLTALQLAVRGRNAAIIVALLAEVPMLLQQNNQLVRELLLVPGLLPQVIASGNPQLVAALLAKISDTGNEAIIQQLSSYGSILHYAAKQGNTEIFAMVLAAIPEADRHFFVVWTSQTFATALHYAAEQGNADIIALLLAEVPAVERAAFVQQPNHEYETALHLAFQQENAQALARLLAEIPDEGKMAFMLRDNDDDDAMLPPLHQAAEQNNTQLFAVLLAAIAAISEDAKLTILLQRGDEFATTLHLAVQQGNRDIVAMLLAAIPAPNKLAFLQKKNFDGVTALYLAAEQGNDEIVAMLLNEVPIDARTRLVLDVTDEPDENNDFISENSWTTLHCAARSGNTTVFNAILDAVPAKPANVRPQFVQAVTDDRDTALHFAARAGNAEMVTRLLAEVPETDKPAFVQAANDDEETALQIAQQNENTDIIALLQPYISAGK